MTTKTRWGILAPGNISRKFATGLAALNNAEIFAVGARSQESAEKFASQFNVARQYVGYEKLVADPDVDAIYVSSPHPFHMEHALLCIDHGKPVLCEKPFAINAEQAKIVINRAREKGVFVMEAMWSRYIPLMAEVRRMVNAGEIGEIRMISSDFGFRTSFNPQGRLFDPALGGGGLLDVGIYPLSFASMLLGKPNRIASMAEIGETGIDEQAAAILGYPSGAMSLISTGVRTQTPGETTIMGSDGRIRIHAPCWIPDKMTITRGSESTEIEIPYEGNGYNYEAAEVARCLADGKLESDLMPHAETIELMETMDEIRAQWGMKYPME